MVVKCLVVITSVLCLFVSMRGQAEIPGFAVMGTGPKYYYDNGKYICPEVVIDRAGNILSRLPDGCKVTGPFRDRLAPASSREYKCMMADGKHMIAGLNSTILDMTELSGGVALALINWQWYVITDTGNVFPTGLPYYCGVTQFVSGIAYYADSQYGSSKVLGVVLANGQRVSVGKLLADNLGSRSPVYKHNDTFWYLERKAWSLFSDGIARLRTPDGTYIYISISGDPVAGTYKEAGNFSEGYAPVSIDGLKWNYIDKKGTIVLVLDSKVELATEFREGRACVKQEDGHWSIIDLSGKVVATLPEGSSPEFDSISAEFLLEGRVGGSECIPVESQVWAGITGGMLAIESDAKTSIYSIDMHLIDDKLYSGSSMVGEFILAHSESRLSIYARGRCLAENIDYSDLVVANKHYAIQGDKWRVCNTSGDVIMELDGHYDISLSDTFVATKKDGVMLVYDMTGGVTHRSEDTSLDFAVYDGVVCAWGLASGIVSDTGVWIVPPRYEETFSYSCGLAAVWRNGCIGFVDVRGSLVIPTVFDYVSGWEFSENRAVAKVGNCKGYEEYRKHEGKQVVIDTLGRVVEFPIPASQLEGFREGVSVFRSNERAGYVDVKGVVVCSWPASAVKIVRAFSDGIGVAVVQSKTYIVERGGKVVSLGEVDISDYSDGYAILYDESKRCIGLVNKRGEVIKHAAAHKVMWVSETMLGYIHEETRNWGLLDIHGNTEADATFTRIMPSRNGLAAAYVGGYPHCGVIDMAGSFVVQPVFHYCSAYYE